MKTSATSIGVVASIVSGAVAAQAVDFEADAVGAPPVGWTCGVTGRGTPHWQVGDDPGAPSARHVLQQTGSGTFPWCVKSDIAIGDGFVEVKLKPISGK
jgi:hypothetical protein